MTQPDVRATMQKLELLDLRKIKTIGELMDGMSRCAFSARRIGEATAQLDGWSRLPRPPMIVYDGPTKGPLFALLDTMVERGYAGIIMTTQEYATDLRVPGGGKVIVVGPYMERFAEKLYEKAEEIIFLNDQGQVRPGLIQEGYFPNSVRCDPNLTMPMIYFALEERRFGARHTLTEFIQYLEQARYPGTAREIVEARRTLHHAVHDSGTKLFLTMAGAMTIAKMQLLVCDLIDLKMVDYISSTGALMAHGLIEGIGLSHYKHDPKHSDALYAEQKINRVTDTLEPEENFTHIEEIVREVLNRFDGKTPISPSIFHRAVGKYLAEHFPNNRAILKSAYEKAVPVACPAFTDSEIGNDEYVESLRRQEDGRRRLLFDMKLDTQLLIDMATTCERRAILSIGGGVPGNNTRNVAPLIDIINNALDRNLPHGRFQYGVKFDPTPPDWGNYSGCTKEEAKGWRKFELDGEFVDVHIDATIGWPLVQGSVMEQLLDRPWRK